MSRPLLSNALAGAAEQVVVGLAYFITYAVLIRESGAELVGVLSLVLVLASVGSMAGAGFASALNHFVPAFEREHDRDSTAACIDTTLLCTALLYVVTLAVATAPFLALVTSQAGPEHADLIGDLIAPALIHVVLIGVGSTTSVALTALLRNDLRFWSTTAGTLAGLVAVVALVPQLGIIGGIWAMVIQSATIAVIAWIQLVRIVPELGPLPRHFRRSMARRLFGLGSNMQAQTLLVASIEPVTRLLVGQFGTLPAVAFFSMASRFIIQIRALVYSGAQPLLSAFSHARAQPEAEFAAFYRRARKTVNLMAIVLLSGAVGASPFVAEVWTGELERSFVMFAAILGYGWMANTLTLAPYFNAYSLGAMHRSLVGHILLAVLNPALGLLLAMWLGGVGAVLGMGLALALSALYLGIANGALAPADASRLGAAKVAGLIGLGALSSSAAVYVYLVSRPALPPLAAGIVSGAAWLALWAPVLLTHDVSRTALQSWRR